MTAINHNLNTFRTLFLVKGILTLCFSIFFMIYIGMGFVFTVLFALQPDEAPFNPGIIFIIFGSIGIIVTITLGVFTLIASKYLKEVRNYNFIFVMAAINALTGILGILLCVFTLIELNKPEIKALFEKKHL